MLVTAEDTSISTHHPQQPIDCGSNLFWIAIRHVEVCIAYVVLFVGSFNVSADSALEATSLPPSSALGKAVEIDFAGVNPNGWDLPASTFAQQDFGNRIGNLQELFSLITKQIEPVPEPKSCDEVSGFGKVRCHVIKDHIEHWPKLLLLMFLGILAGDIFRPTDRGR